MTRVLEAGEATKVRRRRHPDDARREILDAAAGLALETSFHQLSVSDVMRRTTLSRKSFYVYFRDRYDLLVELVRPLRAELDEANRRWLDTDRPTHAAGVANLVAIGHVMQQRGHLLRAVAEGAHHDAEIAEVWRGFVDPVVAAYAARIREETDSGRVPPLDVDRTARALVSMNYAVLFDEVVGNPDADLEAVADALATIWTRALYLAEPRS